ncbi:MAG: DUF2877 domain-containing protein [Streptosporangiaceae bacterium]
MPGAASTPLSAVLGSPPTPGRVIAAFPAAVYVELTGAGEPRVIAVVTPEAARLPNALILGRAAVPLTDVAPGQRASVGGGLVEAGPLRVRAARWWDPSPVLGVIPPAALRDGLDVCAHAATRRASGLAGSPAVEKLGAACAEGASARAAALARALVGLGPGLTPSGDDVLVGLLAALRWLGQGLLDGGTPGGEEAVALADTLAAAVAPDADARTTPLAATLLRCAAGGQAAGELSDVLRGLAGRSPLPPAVDGLLATGHTSGADTAWGIILGGHACLRLAGRPA